MRHNRHLEEFLMLKCAPDLLAARLYPNTKEITEAMGMFRAAVPYGELRKCGVPHYALVVGDGNTPRLGALLAYRTNWTVVSVDPGFKKTDWGINRLTCIKAKIEDAGIPGCGVLPAIVFFPHSHAPMAAVLPLIKDAAEVTVVTMPCCVPVPDAYSALPHRTYRDLHVNSEKNQIHIWTQEELNALSPA